ncbi:VacJ family lipoprotein [Sulfitobacter aestuarii]|uniref:VacJ family lipoprotein n=1 Tax=Sulfitobacter aestuarii TaxID=2161676 RepID=A0ABW5U6Q5_9RHOB
MFVRKPSAAIARGILCAVAALSIAACSSAPNPSTQPGVHDPFEAQNRKVHAFNKSLAGKGKGGGLARAVPEEFQHVIHNVAENLSLPQAAVNALLQGNLRGTGLATYRFAVNTVVGIGGIADVASEFGVPEYETDFGETLHVWGVGEGAYLELPFFGPSTQRDTAGRVVDLFTNPLSYRLDSPEKYVGTVTGLTDKALKNSRRGPAIRQVLNNSADSYAQARLIYLQKRRHELQRGEDRVMTYDDPYAE